MIKKFLATLLLVVLPFTPAFAVSTSTVFDTDTKLMLHMDGTDASTTFTDSSTGAKTVTAVGNTQIDTAQSVFGGASGLFDGAGDYLTLADSTDFDLSGGVWSFDARYRRSSAGGVSNPVIYEQSTDASNTFRIRVNASNKLALQIISGGVTVLNLTSTGTLSADTWYHIYAAEDGDNYYVGIDGAVNSASDTDRPADYSGSVYIASALDGTSQLTGWIDELRLVKGTAVWTSNFTPPSAEYVFPSRRRIITVS